MVFTFGVTMMTAIALQFANVLLPYYSIGCLLGCCLLHVFLVEEGSLSPETIAALEGEGFTLKILPFRTTAENLARYAFERLKDQGLPVVQVEVDETPNNRAFYRA
jgi:hypothetical protein